MKKLNKVDLVASEVRDFAMARIDALNWETWENVKPKTRQCWRAIAEWHLQQMRLVELKKAKAGRK